MDINFLKQKYESTLVKSSDSVLSEIIIKYIRTKGYVMYGGTAIDILIRVESNDNDRLYEAEKEKDYDVFCDDPFMDTQHLAREIYQKMPIQYVKIVTGLTGTTRKLFLNLNPNAIIDMSPYPKKLRWFKDVDGLRVAHPHFLKIDQYKNLSIDVFNNNHRMVKNVKKIAKLEKYFPITRDTIDELHLSDRTYIYDSRMDNPIKPFTDTDDVVFGGDYVFEYYYNGTFSDTAEVILYTNFYGNPEGAQYEIPEKGILTFPRYRMIGLEESMFCYRAVNDDGKEIKICTKLTLIYEYYRLLYLTRDEKYIDRLIVLLADQDLLDEIPEIYVSVSPFVKKHNKSMKSMWFYNGKLVEN